MTAHTTPAAPPHRRAAMLVLIAAVFMNLSEPATDAVLPIIGDELGFTLSALRWLPICIVAPFIPAALLCGQLGDLHGHRRLFTIGAMLSIITYAVLAYSPNFETFVAIRILQGIASGASLSCIIALMTLMYPPEQKRRILSIYVLAVGGTYCLSPIIGSIIAEHTGWRSIYAYRAALAAAIVAATPLLPASQPRKIKADWRGSGWLSIAVTSVILISALLPDSDQRHLAALLLPIAAIAIHQFIRTEQKSPLPLIEVSHFRNRLFSLMQLSALAINACSFALILLTPYISIRLLGGVSVHTGILLSLMPLGMMIASFSTQRMKHDSHTLTRVGLYLAATSLLLCGILIANPIALGAALFAVGIGVGLFQTGFSDITTSLLPPHQRGVSGSLSSLMQRFGFALGAGTITTLPGIVHHHWPAENEYGITLATFGAALFLYSALFHLTVPRAETKKE